MIVQIERLFDVGEKHGNSVVLSYNLGGVMGFFTKVEKVSDTMYKIGNDIARVEYSKVNRMWNAYGWNGDRFEPLGIFKLDEDAIKIAKKHKVPKS